MRGLILGAVLLAAGAATGTVAGTAGAAVEAPSVARAAEFYCDEIREQSDRIAANHCDPAPFEEINDMFVVRDSENAYECWHGAPYRENGIVAEDCEQIG
ncbi:hypothetical protein [Saccharothrix lopnurensis]|uniref:Uncharacterized protein n=1 Tax=Saccharothrix lopnurensis TaxID=1670621 RepID=A0ABW1NXR1_9PSEU